MYPARLLLGYLPQSHLRIVYDYVILSNFVYSLGSGQENFREFLVSLPCFPVPVGQFNNDELWSFV